ncbi:hypothetical protein KC19_1G214100 [Ceratodon purpureus]|uniref:Cytochrome P450 n=1 Tax=Ceratodon purpureus TaxID=3225 RepID=A0A8T0J9L8_CERPU|nr:hypothetical protein KC19_1G214100 [Ceratodon purpureus]KAG0591957.1 hypothetical protein KC19_1G214100 [Ceratodon purpureus]
MEVASGEAGGLVAVTSLAILLVTLIALYLVLERKKFPPGPIAWPVVGSFPAISGALPHRALRNLAEKYGGLMFLRLGSVPTIVVSTAAVAEELFQKHDGNFLDRARPMAFDVVTEQGKNVVMANGPYWRQLRKICISELFTVKRQASYQKIRADEIQNRVKEIVVNSKEGKPINIKDWLQRVTANNMTCMTTNRRFFGNNENKKDIEDFELMIRGIFDLLGAFIISDYVPYLRFVTKLQGWEKKCESLRALYAGVIERAFEIEKHRQRAKDRVDDENFVPDFVDVLLQTPLKNGEMLPDQNINLVMGDMLSGGTETIATAVEWGFAELMLKPELIERLQSELDTVVGTGRLVQESDIPNLPFLQAVVKETFRLHPPLTVNIPREATQAFEFRGYKLPKQTRLILNFHAIHRDPKVYEDPDDFKPDRFLERPEVNHLSGFDSYELTPFSVGRRMCPAYNLGNMMVTLLLAHLMHAFDWSMPEGKGRESLDMTEQFGLTTGMKSPLRLVATPRTPATLY